MHKHQAELPNQNPSTRTQPPSTVYIPYCDRKTKKRPIRILPHQLEPVSEESESESEAHITATTYDHHVPVHGEIDDGRHELNLSSGTFDSSGASFEFDVHGSDHYLTSFDSHRFPPSAAAIPDLRTQEAQFQMDAIIASGNQRKLSLSLSPASAATVNSESKMPNQKAEAQLDVNPNPNPSGDQLNLANLDPLYEFRIYSNIYNLDRLKPKSASNPRLQDIIEDLDGEIDYERNRPFHHLEQLPAMTNRNEGQLLPQPSLSKSSTSTPSECHPLSPEHEHEHGQHPSELILHPLSQSLHDASTIVACNELELDDLHADCELDYNGSHLKQPCPSPSTFSPGPTSTALDDPRLTSPVNLTNPDPLSNPKQCASMVQGKDITVHGGTFTNIAGDYHEHKNTTVVLNGCEKSLESLDFLKEKFSKLEDLVSFVLKTTTHHDSDVRMKPDLDAEKVNTCASNPNELHFNSLNDPPPPAPDVDVGYLIYETPHIHSSQSSIRSDLFPFTFDRQNFQQPYPFGMPVILPQMVHYLSYYIPSWYGWFVPWIPWILPHSNAWPLFA